VEGLSERENFAGGGNAGTQASEDEEVAAEVIVNTALARDEAEKRCKDPIDELLLYVVHGVLHLGGYRDETDEERRRMRAAERDVLSKLGRDPEGAS